MSTLPANVLEKARKEIREDDLRREQSVKQFRDWIEKHPFIRNVKTAESNLMPFLRSRKYMMDDVYASFEKTLIFARKHADWFDWRGEKLDRALDLYYDGLLKVMKDRDSEGRRVIVMNNEINLNKFDPDDFFRLFFLIFVTISMEEETQLCGTMMFSFFLNFSIANLAVYPLHSIHDVALELKFGPIRMSKIAIIGLPSYAAGVFNIIKLGLSDKMKERMQLYDSGPELWEHFDKGIFTHDFGGDVHEKEAIDDFLKVIEIHLENIRDFFESYELDMEMADALKDNNETIGSFRRLEID